MRNKKPPKEKLISIDEVKEKIKTLKLEKEKYNSMISKSGRDTVLNIDFLYSQIKIESIDKSIKNLASVIINYKGV